MSRRAPRPQRADRLCWSLDDASTPLASSSGATAAFTLRLNSAIRPAPAAAAAPWSKLVTAEFFNDEPAAEASYWQELHIHRSLTRSLTPDDCKLYMRQRTSASIATLNLSLAEELCQLRAFERRRSKHESQYHLLCYESYDGTLEIAVDRSSSSASSSSSSSSSAASSASCRRSALRTSLFWCGDADGRADAHAMRSQSSAFIVHCLRCLQAHHRQQVLLGGNIQPAQLFYINEQPAKPVFADYSHAMALKLSEVNPHFTVRGQRQRHTPVSISWHEPSDSLQRRSTQPQLPLCLVRRPTLATETPSTFGELEAQLKICLKRDDVLASLVPSPLDSAGAQLATGRDSNSSRYRAPEAKSAGELSGFCCEASDVYSMCATLIDVLCGHDRDPLGSGESDSFHEECSRQFDDDDPWTHSEWIKLGAPAIIDGNVSHFFREAMKSVSLHSELSELIDQVQSSNAAWTQHQLRVAAAAAAKDPPLYATCRQLRVSQQKDVPQSRHGLTFSVSPRLTVVEEQPSRPTLIAKRFPLPLSATHRYQSRIADHLQAKMAPDDHRRFVRQRLRPDERLERAIAAVLYPRAERVAGQHRLTDAERRAHTFSLSRKEVMFFRYYAGSLADAIVTPASNQSLALQLRVDWFWQTKQDSSPLALQGDAEAMQRKALRLVLHCLQGLAAHHACGVLLGDIKPSNLLHDHPLSDEQAGATAAAASSSSSSSSSFDRECRPRWGDYDHAVNMLSIEWGSHVRIISKVADRFGGYGISKQLQLQLANEAKETGELVGVLTQSIGTWPYQAPEIFAPPAPSVIVLDGQYHSRSDAYALALTLLEVCVGRPFVATPSTRLVGLNQELRQSHVQPLLSFSRDATQNPSTCAQLAMTSWLLQPFALLPEEVIELLQQLLLPDLDERPTIACVIVAVEELLAE